MVSVLRLSLLLLPAVACLATRHAHGQIINQFFPQGVPGYDTGLGVTVQSRVRDGYIVPGVRWSEFVVKPSLNESVGYNSNVTGSLKPRGSLQINTALTLQVSTDWSRNGFFTYLSVNDLAFPDLPEQNQTNWVAEVGGTHEFGRDQLQLGYSHFNLQQTAADLGSLNFQTPATFHVDDVRSSYKAEFGRMSIQPGIQVSNYTFDQTAIAGFQNAEQDRDRTLMVGMLGFSYGFAPQRNALLVLRGYDTTYAHVRLGQPSRDNTGLSILGGLEYTANGVFRYRGMVGLEQRSYASRVYGDQATLVGEGELIWTPTGLTTVTAAVSRAIEDAAAETTGGFVYTSARFTVDHEYKKNILFRGYTGIQSAAFQQSGGSQTITNVGGGITWLLNRNFHMVVNYDFVSSRASASTAGFVGNRYRRNLVLLQVSLML